MYIQEYVEFVSIVGLTFSAVEYNNEEETLIFTCTNGKTYIMKHEQDCCEHVYLAETTGDLSDLLNTPILMAEKASQDNTENSVEDESSTWTFYKLATAKGYVDLRWYGSSNGYYSEGVSFGVMEEE